MNSYLKQSAETFHPYFDRNNNDNDAKILMFESKRYVYSNSQRRMKKMNYHRYRSGSSSDSAINFDHLNEDNDEVIESENCNLFDDFNYVLFNFICLTLQQKPLPISSKRLIGIIKRYLNLEEKVQLKDTFGFLISKDDCDDNGDERIYFECVVNELLNARSKRYWNCNCESVKCSIREYGIPNEIRAQIWLTFIKAKIDFDNNISDIDGLLKKANDKILEKPLDEVILRQIELDVTRTFPNHSMFDDSNGISKLTRVLVSYCIHLNPSIGYCQGMNFIAALLLIVFDGNEKHALMGLICIIDYYFPPHYYDAHLTGARADQMLLKDLIISNSIFSETKGKPNQMVLDEITSALTLNWFLSLFHGAIPWQIRLQILDCFWVEGVKVIFRFSLSLLKLGLSSYSGEILSSGDMMNAIRDTIKNSYDIFELKRIAFDEIKLPKRKHLASQRTFYHKRIMDKLNMSNNTESISYFSNKKKKGIVTYKNGNYDDDQNWKIAISSNHAKVALFKDQKSFGKNDCQLTILDADTNQSVAFKSKFIKNSILIGISNDGKRVIFCQNSTKIFKKLKDTITIELFGLRYNIHDAFYIESIESIISISKNGIVSKVSSIDKNCENIMIVNDKEALVLNAFVDYDYSLIWVALSVAADHHESKRNKTNNLISIDLHTLDIMNIVNIDCYNIYRISALNENITNLLIVSKSDIFKDKINRIEMMRDGKICKTESLYGLMKYDHIVDLKCYSISEETDKKGSHNTMIINTLIVIVTKSGTIIAIHNKGNANNYTEKKLPFLISEATRIVRIIKKDNNFMVTLATTSSDSLVNVFL